MNLKNSNAKAKKNAEKLRGGNSKSKEHVANSLTGSQSASDKLRRVNTTEKREDAFRTPSKTHGGASLKKKKF